MITLGTVGDVFYGGTSETSTRVVVSVWYCLLRLRDDTDDRTLRVEEDGLTDASEYSLPRRRPFLRSDNYVSSVILRGVPDDLLLGRSDKSHSLIWYRYVLDGPLGEIRRELADSVHRYRLVSLVNAVGLQIDKLGLGHYVDDVNRVVECFGE